MNMNTERAVSTKKGAFRPPQDRREQARRFRLIGEIRSRFYPGNKGPGNGVGLIEKAEILETPLH